MYSHSTGIFYNNLKKAEPLQMSSNNDPIIIPIIQRNTSVLPGTNSSDLRTCTEPAVLSFHKLSYREKWQSGFPLRRKTFEVERLSNVSGIMKPGLNAIMGPQDGGRSLLLNVLAARKDPRGLSGDILINGAPRPANFKCNSGYVPQIDKVKSTMTMRENLEFSAALRLPMTIMSDERRRRINEALERLGLDKVANSKPRSKEDSKRTSIAMELFTDHRILFLDEPTTGLDSSTANDIIVLLKWMSREGRTIIFSINQPQYSIFRLFDSLTLVASGKVLFHGPAQDALDYFKSAGFHCEDHNNPADFFLDVISGCFSAEILDSEKQDHEASEHKKLFKRENQAIEKLAEMYTQSSFYEKTRADLDQLSGEQSVDSISGFKETAHVTTFCHQIKWIIWRSFKNCIGFPRDTMFQTIITFALAVVVATISTFRKNDCTEAQSRASLLCLLTVFLCITSVSAGELFVTEAEHFLHEHTSGYYKELPYFLGKLVSELLPRRLFQSILFTVVLSCVAGVRTGVKGFCTMMFTVMLLAVSTSSLPLSLGAGENAVAVPTVLVTIYFVFMLFFSGLSLYSEALVPEVSWIQYFSIPHYGLTALQYNEFRGQKFCSELNTAEISSCQNYVICTGEEYLTIQGIDLSSWGFWKNHVALAFIMIILLTATFVQLLFLKKKHHF